MKKLIMLAIASSTAFILNAERPKGPLRWEKMSETNRRDFVSQVVQRRQGERLVIMRSAFADSYRLNDIRYPVSVEEALRLDHIAIGHYAVFCGIYQRS